MSWKLRSTSVMSGDDEEEEEASEVSRKWCSRKLARNAAVPATLRAELARWAVSIFRARLGALSTDKHRDSQQMLPPTRLRKACFDA